MKRTPTILSMPWRFTRGGRRRPVSRLRAGFTLIEAAIVTAIIGMGVLAMMQLLAAGTISNMQGTRTTTGLNIAKNIREAMVGLAFVDKDFPESWGPEAGETTLTFDDIDDFDGAIFSPPISALKKPVAEMSGWEQRVVVDRVDENALTVEVPSGSSKAARIRVEVYQNGKFVCQTEWFAFDVSQ